FFIISSIAVQTPDSGISNLLAVGTTFTGSRNLYCQWELSPGSGNALCILFPTERASATQILCVRECLTSDSITNDVCAIVRTTDVRMPLDAKISSSCVGELSKGLEIEAKIAKKNKMLFKLEKRCSYIEKDYIDLEIKFQEYRDCFESPNLNGYKIENQTLSKRYEELAKSNMSSRAQLTGRITALIAKNATLKVGVKGKQNSRPTQLEKPKVLTPGMFAICTKYIPPPRRENWVAPAPKPRKKQVTFREPPRPSHSTTQKTVM
nr:hypothetical protein [Tanacetum cinerariifolium]